MMRRDSFPSLVAAELTRWASTAFDTRVTLVEPPIAVTGGYDCDIFLIRVAGGGLPEPWQQPLIVRVPPNASRSATAHREAAVQGWCASRGYPTPTVLAVFDADLDDGRTVQVMNRAPGVPMARAMQRRPWRVPHLIDRLAALHLSLHALDPGGWPDPDPHGTNLVERRLDLPRQVAAGTGDPHLLNLLAYVDDIVLPQLSVLSPRVCHGDLHPLNVLVAGSLTTVLDWTDAGLGDPHGDVSRTALLFELAGVLADNPVERKVLRSIGPRLARRYLRLYQQHADLDPDRLHLWEPVHLAHASAQALDLERRDAPGVDARRLRTEIEMLLVTRVHGHAKP